MSVTENDYIYGLHDTGGQHLLDGRGWLVVSEEIGHDPTDQTGGDYAAMAEQGLGLIVRLNNGYGPSGTLPNVDQYQAFAVRCGHFVQASQGCHIWIIGNEPNHPQEWPDGNPIFPGDYALCYRLCRAEIRRRPGHEHDLVLVAGPGPWNATVKYATNLTGDWVQYLQDQIWGVQDFDQVDGVSLHTYTHGHNPALIRSTATMAPPFENRHYQFWAYRDFLYGLMSMGFLDKPLYITETNGDDRKWSGGNNGWVKDAYKDINAWNEQNPRQVIRCAALFRWQADPLGYSIETNPGVQQDIAEAMQAGYTWPDKVAVPKPPPTEGAARHALETAGHLEVATESNRRTLETLTEDDLAAALAQATETASYLASATESNQRLIETLKQLQSER